MNSSAAAALRRTPERGVVLVITLALIVLITVAVVAYFSRTMTNRRIESATAAAIRADTLARSATQLVVGDVISEIVGGSTVLPGTFPMYRPTAPEQAVPARVLALAGMATNPNFNNLVKQSVGRFFPSAYAGTPSITTSSGRDTSIPSVNRRIVSVSRWNAPVLNSGAAFTSPSELPEWILVDRRGAVANQTWDTAFADTTPGNNQAVVGRFAFNVYDVGGLLDANVAGYPVERTAAGSPGFSAALTDGEMQSLKGTQAGAHLFSSTVPIIPGFNRTTQTAFVNAWKFGSAGTSKLNFLLDFMTRSVPPSSTVSPTFADSGFLRPTVRNPGSTTSNTNTRAYSRRELIQLSQAAGGYLPPAALPYLTHFSRELNAPSWMPTQDASDMGGNNGSGSPPPYAYRQNKDNPAVPNRDVLGVRVVTAFTRADGTQAIVGEPLIKNRFPLRRLDGIGNTGVNSAGFPVLLAGTLRVPTSATVQRDFGLTWNGNASRWDYVGASTSVVQPRILTLDEVAQGRVLTATGSYAPTSIPREPNFFEILKAFTLSGSLGVGSTGTTLIAAEPRFVNSDVQTIRTGTNIVDQWDSDKNPTFIQFGPDEIAGVENLPLLNKLLFQPRWDVSTATPRFKAWLVPSFWAAAQNGSIAGTASTTAPFTIPSVRFVMRSGSVSATIEGVDGISRATSAPVTADAAVEATQPSVQLTGTASFGPVPDAAASQTTIKNLMTSAPSSTTASKLGIELVFAPTIAVTKDTTARAYPTFTNATFEMQARIGGPSGTWKTYQQWTNAQLTGNSLACQPPAGSAFDWTAPNASVPTAIYDPEFVLLDPRTMRFGVWASHAAASGDSTDYTRGVNETLERPGASGPPPTGGFQKITGLGPQGDQFSGAGPEMATNAASGAGVASYTDVDGVRRRGNALAASATSPLLPTNSADRLPVLSRQLRTVAELGTVSRDQPWKGLNFTTADSADAGLLDAFSIFEPNSVFRSDITGGKISLNTRQAPALRAVLAGIATRTETNTPLITDGQRDAVIDAMMSLTAAQPMMNKSELVTRLAADPSVMALGNKEAREAVIRALSDVGQTRTWNLMIDVIAQAGRYGRNAASVDDFIVEGEKRYWLHVAIDRFTGQIIDQQLEAVVE